MQNKTYNLYIYSYAYLFIHIYKQIRIYMNRHELFDTKIFIPV